MSDLDGIRIPDVAGEILGWRAWKVIEGESRHARLQSVTASDFGVPDFATIWPADRWMVAVCIHGHAEVPHEGCKCGLYAAETRDFLLRYGYANYSSSFDDLVIGVAGLVGKVIPGQQGWKAQRARIVRLEVPYEKERLARTLMDVYRVPVGLGLLFNEQQARSGGF